MNCLIENKIITLVNDEKNIRIILNYNNENSEMALNTFVSIKNIIDNDIKNECYIINVNRYESKNIKIISKLKIKKPNIKIFSLNTSKFLSTIKDKLIVDLDEVDRMMIVFTASNIDDIYSYIKTNKDFEETLFKVLE